MKRFNLAFLGGQAFILPLLMSVTFHVHAADSLPETAALPAQSALPDPLTMFDGRPVRTREMWLQRRRPELKELFQHYMYGYLPPPSKTHSTVERIDKDFFGGKATLKEVTLRLGSTNVPAVHLLLVVPNQRVNPAPVFVGLNFCGNHALLDDPKVRLPTGWMPNSCPGCTNNKATDTGRGKQTGVWALEQSIDRGYAVATLYNGDIEPDRPDAPQGIRAAFAAGSSKPVTGEVQPRTTQAASDERLYRPAPGRDMGSTDCGTIAAWAWGLHRAVDYLYTDRDIDTNRIAVFGHSRNGKTALLAAAFDERISLAIPHQAGCGGTAPSRGKIGESVKQINDRFPHWFDGEFKKFNEQPEKLPFDQHCLIALIAPRPVLLSNATEDTWANPAGQFEMLQAAEPVYRLLGAGGLGANQQPPPGKLIDTRLGYFIRAGKHSTTPDDWKIFLDFADRHFGKAR